MILAPENRLEEAERLVLAGEAALAEEDTAGALPLLDAAERAGAEPDRCAGNRWLAHMLDGEFEAAWRESDAIRRRGAPDPHRFWLGEDLRGKRVMLRSLHGFGDAVQMLRFVPRLQALAAHVTFEVPPRMVELACCFAGMEDVVTWGAGAPDPAPAWDVQCEVMELPYLLQVLVADLEPRGGYLRVPEPVRNETLGVLGPKRRPRVGLVWTAGHWNPSRSIPWDVMRALGTVPGWEFWSLQGEKDRLEAGARPGDLGWRDVEECGDGILRLASVVEQMDLVITVDTLAAHLAGALGVPCWVLLQDRADWRWMRQRADSPWYPSLRLWRQRSAGDWAGLVDEVRTALSARAG